MKMRHVVLAGLLILASPATSARTTAALKPGDIAPSHIGTTLDGKPVLVTDFPGKVVIVSYWATWCTFCIKELAMLDAVQKTASDRVQVVTVNIEPVYVFRKIAKKLAKLQVPLLRAIAATPSS